MSWSPVGTFPPIPPTPSLPGVRVFTFQPIPNGAITIAQLKRGLKTQAVLQTISDAISADITSEANIQWTSGETVVQGDPLALFILLVLSVPPYNWTEADMNTLFALSATMQP